MKDHLNEAAIAAIPVAVLFFSGWAYLSSYLGSFGVDITEIDVPLSTILVFSFKPLGSWIALLLCLVGVGILLVVAYLLTPEYLPRRPRIALIAVFGVLFVFTALFSVNSLARSAATEAASEVWTGERSRNEVPLAAQGDQGLIQADYRACLERRGFVHVFSTTARSFLLCRDRTDPSTIGMLYIVSESGSVLSRRKVMGGKK